MKIDVEEVVKSKLSLEDVLELICLYQKEKGKFFPYSSNDVNRIDSLETRGMVITSLDYRRIITKTGLDIVRNVLGLTPIPTKVIKDANFEEFWSSYPTTDAHGIWKRTRALKANRAKSTTLYNNAIKSGVKHDDIIKAIKWEVADRKSNSSTRNNLTFMKASTAWLMQKEYEIIKEMMDEKGEQDDSKDWTQSTV